jgi:FixJ family two-component response regulator
MLDITRKVTCEGLTGSVMSAQCEDVTGAPAPIVYIVDDDVWVGEALVRLMHTLGYRSTAYRSAPEFLADHDSTTNGCVILDLAMPGFGGLDLQRLLNQSEAHRPVIFLTGCGSIPLSVQAMKSGAIAFLTKPIAPAELAVAVEEALEADLEWRSERAKQDAARRRLGSLTPREREVLDYVLEGRLNKQIAAALGTCEQTVKVHRSRVMRKMGVRTVAELIWLAARSGQLNQSLIAAARVAE